MWQQSWRGCGASTDKYEPRRSLRRFPFRFANQDATKIVEVRSVGSFGNVTIIFLDASPESSAGANALEASDVAVKTGERLLFFAKMSDGQVHVGQLTAP